MIDGLFTKVYTWTNKHQRVTITALIIVLLISVYGLFFISFNNNIELMLPADKEFSESLKFLRESNFSDKVILSLGLKSPNQSMQDLIAAASILKKRLKAPYVQQIDEGIFENNILEDMKGFLSYVPQIITESELSDIKDKINAKDIEAQLKKSYNQMLSPSSVFTGYFLQNDPLAIKSKHLKSVQSLMDSMGYKAKVQGGHFVSVDGRNVMLILSTPIRVTDSAGSRKLMNYLDAQLEFLPKDISVDIISGHLHTLSNEDILKKDISKTAFVISFVLLILLFLVFKDIRALIVFFVPVIAMLVSINLTYLMLGKLSMFVVGMGVVIAGITVDYGIHIYLAVQSGGVDKVKQVAKPIIVGVLTTMGVFSAFFFSSIYGYKQFALFTNFSILISIFIYLFMLPRFLSTCSSSQKQEIIPSKREPSRFGRGRVKDKIIILGWFICVVIMVIFARRLEFGNDMRAYDGSADKIFEAEDRFHKQWGLGEDPAIFVVRAERLEDALKINEEIYPQAKEILGEDNFSSLAKVYPSMKTRHENLSRWKSFWKGTREDTLKGLLNKYGKVFNFSEDAFFPFFDGLYEGSVTESSSDATRLLGHIKNRFIQKTKHEYQVMSFFPDKKEFVRKMRTISDRLGNTFIISRNNMAESISVSVYQEVIKLAWIAAAFIILLTGILLKDIRLTALALLPVISSVCTILGMMTLLGFSLNASVLIATLVIIGLCIDYGVFMVYDCKRQLKAKTLLAVTLSAITTLAGGGVLLLAQHPVLFYVGVTMAIGILSGYVVAIGVIPSGYRLWIERD